MCSSIALCTVAHFKVYRHYRIIKFILNRIVDREHDLCKLIPGPSSAKPLLFSVRERAWSPGYYQAGSVYQLYHVMKSCYRYYLVVAALHDEPYRLFCFLRPCNEFNVCHQSLKLLLFFTTCTGMCMCIDYFSTTPKNLSSPLVEEKRQPKQLLLA